MEEKEGERPKTGERDSKTKESERERNRDYKINSLAQIVEFTGTHLRKIF